MLRYIPSFPTFSRTFIKKSCWILSKIFFFSYWDDLILTLCWLIAFNDLCILNYSCSSWIKTTFSSCIIFLMYVCLLFEVFYLAFLSLNSLGILASSFLFSFLFSFLLSFLLCLYLVLVLEWYWFHRKSLGACLLFHFTGMV